MDEYLNRDGEKFINKLFQWLYNSNEVQNSREKSDDRITSIAKYMERLESIHQRGNTEHRKDLLKSLYFRKYIINYSDIPKDMNKNEKQRIIKNQKQTLGEWLDYLTEPTNPYPMWLKFWIFQSVIKMGTKDQTTGFYNKRAKKTLAPFPSVNPEIIAKCVDILLKEIKKEGITTNHFEDDKELQKLVENGNFSKMYSFFEKKYKKSVKSNTSEGIWIKYNQGSKEEAIKLSKSLEGKNTGWCTAGEDIAIYQVCDPYEGGDFYVYYTKDNEGKYTNPRIAIRMIGKEIIGEIRGILEHQNLEESMIDILEKKLKSMNLSSEEVSSHIKAIEDLKELSIIADKMKLNQKLSKREIYNLYTKKYGFGWQNDPRVKKIINKRSIVNDLEYIDNNDDKAIIIIEYFEEFPNEYRFDDYNLLLSITEKDKTFIEKLSPSNTIYYEKIVNYLLKQKKYAFATTTIKYIKPEYVKDYDKLAKKTVKIDPGAIEHIKPENVKDYNELAYKAVKDFKRNIRSIKPEYVKNYNELAYMAVKDSGYNIKFIKPENVKDYTELAYMAVKDNGYNIKFIKPENVNDYNALAYEAVIINGNSIEYIDPSQVKYYDILAYKAVKSNGISIQHIKPEHVKNYDILAYEAVKNNREAIEFIDPNLVSNYNELLTMSKKEVKITNEKKNKILEALGNKILKSSKNKDKNSRKK